MKRGWRQRLKERAILLDAMMPLIFYVEAIYLVVFFPWLLLLPFVLLAIFMGTNKLRRRSALRLKGYWVVNNNYEEATAGGVEKLQIPHEMWGPGEYALLIPSGREWKATAPP